jgi:hypothetical protein
MQGLQVGCGVKEGHLAVGPQTTTTTTAIGGEASSIEGSLVERRLSSKQ